MPVTLSLKCLLTRKILINQNVNGLRTISTIGTPSSSPILNHRKNVRFSNLGVDGNLKFPYNAILNHELSSMASKSTEFTKSNHTFTGHNVIVEGKKIHFEKAGNGSHIILLMPGAIGTGKTDFLPQLNGLNPDLFTIIAWDPPGYGDSRPPEKDFNNFYANDAAMASKFMKVLNYHRYSVMGWSGGGITAMILAANDGISSIQKLIIWGSNAYVNEEDRSAVERVRDPKTCWSESFRNVFINIYGEEEFYSLWSRWVSYYMTLDDICKKDLSKIDCPVLILHGDLDPMVAPEHPLYLVNNIPNATLYRFPKGKHNIHQRYAEEFNKLCEDFLTSK